MTAQEESLAGGANALSSSRPSERARLSTLYDHRSGVLDYRLLSKAAMANDLLMRYFPPKVYIDIWTVTPVFSSEFLSRKLLSYHQIGMNSKRPKSPTDYHKSHTI
jgi:hypothetical protein